VYSHNGIISSYQFILLLWDGLHSACFQHIPHPWHTLGIEDTSSGHTFRLHVISRKKIELSGGRCIDAKEREIRPRIENIREARETGFSASFKKSVALASLPTGSPKKYSGIKNIFTD